MIEKQPGVPGEFTTIVGADALFKGELAFEKSVRVDGAIEGKVTSKGHIAISQGGRLQAEVQAASIIVEGDVIGNLTATDRVELRKSARVKGDIRAAKLLVAEGAAFTGQCHVGGEVPAAGTVPPAVNRLAQAEMPRK
jgi:cytoskeletal protein CcmA (bactofilin family)